MIVYFVSILCRDFLSDCRAVKIVLGLFKWVGGARFGFSFLGKKKQKQTKDIEIITSCCNLANVRTQTYLQICAELYARVLNDSGPKLFNINFR